MPNEFVTKCTHDSGSVKVFSDIDKFTKNDLLNIEREYDHFYLKRNFGYKFFEMQYVDIKPRIIVEKYMGESIKDYKFLCFNGEPYF